MMALLGASVCAGRWFVYLNLNLFVCHHAYLWCALRKWEFTWQAWTAAVLVAAVAAYQAPNARVWLCYYRAYARECILLSAVLMWEASTACPFHYALGSCSLVLLKQHQAWVTVVLLPWPLRWRCRRILALKPSGVALETPPING